MVPTVNDGPSVPFYKGLANQGLEAAKASVVVFPVGEEELRDVDTRPLVGNLTA